MHQWLLCFKRCRKLKMQGKGYGSIIGEQLILVEAGRKIPRVNLLFVSLRTSWKTL